MTSDRPFHGGNLFAATQIFAHPENGWLDLSTGINPTPYDVGSPSLESFTRLPQPDALSALLAAARQAYGIDDKVAIVAAPGSQAILQLLPSLRPACNVAVLSPTYEEHAAGWRSNGHSVTEVQNLGECTDTDVVVVVNPNNPDGRIVALPDLRQMAEKLAARQGWLLVDEAFADVTPEASALGLADLTNVIVVRSFGKFFGLPGLRLGFAVGGETQISALESRLGPWAVSGPAIEIGTRALRDSTWIADMRRTLAAQRQQLDALLAGHGLEIVGGTDLFRLVSLPNAITLYRGLGKAGVLVRPFERHPSWLRIGLPAPGQDFDRLASALASL